jgi:hypothetical protein
MLFYVLNSLIGVVIMILFAFFKKQNWKNAIVFMLLYNGIVLFSFVNSKWLDTDLIITMIPVFLPITIGINMALLMELLNPIFKNRPVVFKLFYGIVIVGFTFFIVNVQEKTVSKLVLTDKTPKTVLDAYDQITETFIPFTYAVVNDNSAELISKNKHFFINYNYFLKEYPKKDSVFYSNIKNPYFFKIHPEYVLPNSVLVFVYNPNTIPNTSIFKESCLLEYKIRNQLENLKEKGRKIDALYKSDVVEVYEIINVPKKSKTKDLIYEK